MTIIMTVTHPNDHDDNDLPAGGELMCVWVQGEGVGGDGDLIMTMIIKMIRMIIMIMMETWGMTLSP